jgi:putative DNA primase/helicase
MQARTQGIRLKGLEAAAGHWPRLLMELGGLAPSDLCDREGPCPSCAVLTGDAGNTRFRFDDIDGSGSWYCHHCGGKNQTGGGGNGIDLLMRLKGWAFPQALQAVEAHLGLATSNVVPLARKGRPHRRPTEPPAGTAPPELGRAVAQFAYGPDRANPWFYIQRVPQAPKTPGAKPGKLFVHRTWLDNRWHYPSKRDAFRSEWPAPRPLYRLPELIEHPDAEVLVVEGEGAADAAAQLFTDRVVVSWCGGTGGINTVDWSVLAGRTVALWPDADAPGREGMAKLAQLLLPIATKVMVVQPPAEAPAGWDLADALAEGWKTDQAAEHLAQHAKVIELPEPPVATAQPSSPPAAVPQQAPYQVLGWDASGPDLSRIWIQTGSLGLIATIPATKQGLQRIAPISYWESVHPTRTGVCWDAAVSNLCQHAEKAGVFAADRLRGRGVWRDRGRTVWNHGDHLEVDGVRIRHVDATHHGLEHSYACRPPLKADPTVAPLTDAEGAAILDLLHRRMRWETAADGLLVAGHIVIGNVGGALEIRPPVQYTGKTQEGKSTLLGRVVKPLQPDLLLRTKSTEAGIRQELLADSMPVVIDESEQEDARMREGHLLLARLSFDGQTQSKGSAGHRAVQFSQRSVIALSGINTPIPNQADLNRMVVIRPRKMPADQWARFQADRDELITTAAGHRLVRRTVSTLPALLANITTFTKAVAATAGGDRRAQVYGTLLAAAHHLTNTEVIDLAAARTWLASVGWEGPDQEEQDAVAGDAEARACLDHLLAHPVPWKASETGATDVRGLLAIVRGLGAPEHLDSSAAAKALGQRGVKFDAEAKCVVVSNHCSAYKGTRWDHKAHKERLRELPGAAVTGDAVRFPGSKTVRGVKVPIEHLGD